MRASKIDFENSQNIYNSIKSFEGYDYASVKLINPNAPDYARVALENRVTKLTFVFKNVIDPKASERYINSFMLDLGYKNFDFIKEFDGPGHNTEDMTMTAIFKPIRKLLVNR